MIKNNIFEEADYKLKNEKLNSNVFASYYTNLKDDDGTPLKLDCLDFSHLFNYRTFLFDNILETKFQPIFKYKPEYLSYEIYGTSSYDYLILYANDIDNKRNFVRNNFRNDIVKYFSLSAVHSVEADLKKKHRDLGKEIKVENYLLYNI